MLFCKASKVICDLSCAISVKIDKTAKEDLRNWEIEKFTRSIHLKNH